MIAKAVVAHHRRIAIDGVPAAKEERDTHTGSGQQHLTKGALCQPGHGPAPSTCRHGLLVGGHHQRQHPSRFVCLASRILEPFLLQPTSHEHTHTLRLLVVVNAVEPNLSPRLQKDRDNSVQQKTASVRSESVK